MFDNYTMDSLKVVMLAQEEARRLGQVYISTEHILLGILGTGAGPSVCGDGVGARVLRNLGIKLNDARLVVTELVGNGTYTSVAEIPLDLAAKQALEEADNRKIEFGHSAVNTGHLLLGLLSITEGLHCQILNRFKVDPMAVREEILRSFEASAISEIRIASVLSIAGANQVIQLFGKWPSFHDSEILEMYFSRSGESYIVLQDESGILVRFNFAKVTDLELKEFNHQNVIFELTVESSEHGHRLTLCPCFGVAGFIEAEEVSVLIVDQVI